MSISEIPLSAPFITDREIDLVVRTLRSGRLSIGPMQERFEQMVADRTGRSHGVAVSSGTAGLHLALLALGVGPGDEVITTPFSFVASANCILYTGAKPVFVDVCPKSLNMDPSKLEAAITERTKAIIAVEALGAEHKGRPAGSFGRVGVFGFYPNKQITTGEGGMIVTDDDQIARMCKSLRNHGRAVTQNAPGSVGSWLAHERLGYNYRLSEVSAALGVAQMERLDELLEARQRVAQQYIDRLLGVSQVVLPTVDPETRMSWFVFVVRLESSYTREERDRIIAGLRRHDVGSADYFPCIHLQPFYREMFGFEPGRFPIAEAVSQRTLALPFYGQLSRRDVDFVAQTLELMITRENLGRGD